MRKRALVLLAAIAVFAPEVAAGEQTLAGCRIFRNGWISRIPRVPGTCVHDPGSRVEVVEAWVPVGDTPSVDGLFSVLLAVLVAGLPLLCVSRAATTRPGLLVFHGSLAAFVWLSLSGVRGAGPERLEAAAWCLLPAALVHLLFTFPERRPLLERAPAVVRTPYLAAAVGVAVAWFSLEKSGLVWAALGGMLFALSLALGLMLVLACLVRWRESEVPLERVRARTVVAGALLMALAATLVGMVSLGAAAWNTALLAWLGLVTTPVLLATSRYSLFDLRHDAGRTSRCLAMACAAAGIVAIAAAPWVPAGDRWSQAGVFAFALAGGCLASALGRLGPSPRVRHAREERGLVDGLAGCTDEADVARVLARSLHETIPATRVAIFRLSERGPSPLAALGAGPPVSLDLCDAGRRLLGGKRSVALWSWSEEERRVATPLVTAGVDLILGLRFRESLVGLALVAATARPHPTRIERSDAEVACDHAAAHLAHGRLFQHLLEAERRASAGRTAVDLAHDLGKELLWIHRISRRLARRAIDGSRERRDLSIVADLAEERAEALRAFVRAAVSEVAAPAGRAPLLALVSRCADAVSRRTGHPRPVCVVDPEARGADVELGVGLLLGSLLDNACRASPDGAPVSIRASKEAGLLRIEVRDQGAGLARETRARVFEPGFTTRAHDGSGAGLALAREAARSFGGSLALAPARGGGTCATLELPA